jgi:prepilin-type N-terminal cleavage/methylation domain-containing protein
MQDLMVQQNKMHRFSAGFTLVELAMAIVIIGMLLGGVLKGQELIENARLTVTVAQTKSIQSAALLFKDTYGTLPGDVANAASRIPGCSNNTTLAAAVNGMVLCTSGNGDGRLDAGPTGTAGPDAGAVVTYASNGFNNGNRQVREGWNFFPMMMLTDMISQESGDLPVNIGGATIRVKGLMTSSLARGTHFRAGQLENRLPSSVFLLSGTVTFQKRPGIYIVLDGQSPLQPIMSSDPIQLITPPPTVRMLSPAQVYRIDQKYDDGMPAAGYMFGAGYINATSGCISANNANATYNTKVRDRICSAVYIRVSDQ